MTFTPRTKIVLFLVFACTVSWFIAGVFWVMNGDWQSPGGRAVAMTYGMPPAFGALVVKAIAKDRIIEDLGLSFRLNRWFVIAWVLPVVWVGTALLIAWFWPGAELELGTDAYWDYFRGKVPEGQREAFESSVAAAEQTGTHPALRQLLQGMVGGLMPASIVALGQELGWRGLLSNELRAIGAIAQREARTAQLPRRMAQLPRRMAQLQRGMVVGVIWGLWYVPIALQGFGAGKANALGGTITLVAFCVAISPAYQIVRDRSGSVLPCAIMAGTMMALSSLPAPLVRADGDLLASPFGPLAVLAAAAVSGALLALPAPPDSIPQDSVPQGAT